MSAEEFEALKADIQANGLREPIWTHDSQIIDGRNRYNACEEIGIKPRFREWDGVGELWAFVVSLNLKRRHLTSSQLAVVALDIEKYLAEEAKLRQIAAQNNNAGRAVSQIIDQQVKGKAAEQAAAIVGTNRQYVSDAKKIEKTAPDLLPKVRSGEITIPEAKREIRRAERIENIAEVSRNNTTLDGSIGQFPVIYCDPPWQYDFMSVDAWKVENHYPTMTTEQICAEAVGEVTTKDAILFMWATAPKLADAMRVIAAWGFTYKTCAIWDKDWTGMGNYFRIQHELLLIATRGNIPPPETDNRPASIVKFKRSTKHSEKPEVFYEIIEKMYPELPKIELFARRAREGWTSKGNEI